MKRVDPIVAEIHRVRLAIGRRYGFDVRRIAAAMQARAAERGGPVVSRPPRRVPRKRAP
jgi:hypothetical protein